MASKFVYDRLFGDNISDDIRDKLETRQNLNVGVDFGDSVTNSNKTNFNGSNDMSSRIPWARMWTVIQNYSLSPDIEEIQKKAIENSENVESSVIINSTKVYTIGDHNFDDYVDNLHSVGSSIANDFLSNNQFNKPNAGIKSVSVSTIGQMGLVKETIINFKVFNYFDYENIVVPFFMTPGSRLFVDFGWDTSLIYDPNKFISGEANDATFEYETFNEKIYGENNGVISKSNGDLEVIAGLVSKFDVKIDDGGHFDCTVTLTSQNYSLIDYSQDTGINIPSFIKNNVWDKIKERIKKDTDGEIDVKKLSDESYGKITKNLLSLYVGANTKASFSGNTDSTSIQFPVIPEVSYETGIYYRMIDDIIVSEIDDIKKLSTNNSIYITFKYFGEILNDILSFGAMENINVFTDGDIKFNFEDIPVGFDENIYVRQLYLSKWGQKDLKFLFPNKYSDPYSSGGEETLTSDSVGNIDHVNLSDVFIKLDMITAEFSNNNSIEVAMKSILDKINDESFGFLSLKLIDDGTVGDKIRICDIKNFPSKKWEVRDDNEDDMFEFKVFSPNTVVSSIDLSMNLSNNAMANRLAIQGLNASSMLFPVSEQMKVDMALKDNNVSIGDNQFYTHLPILSKESGEKFVNRSMSVFKNSNIKEEKTVDDIQEQNKKIDKKNLQMIFSNPSLLSNLKMGDEDKEKLVEATKGDKKDLTDRETVEHFPKEVFVNNINTYFKYKLNMKQIKNKVASIILPYTLSFSIYGISGIVPGNKFKIDYLPKNYKDNTFFIVTKISHSIDGVTWKTDIQAQMRLNSNSNKTFNNIVEYSPSIHLAKRSLYKMGYSDSQIGEIQDINDPIEFWKVIPSNYFKGCLDEEAENYDPYALFDCTQVFGGGDSSCCYYASSESSYEVG